MLKIRLQDLDTSFSIIHALKHALTVTIRTILLELARNVNLNVQLAPHMITVPHAYMGLTNLTAVNALISNA